ncbi:hypothetical protein GGR50DRAFT_214248 [Xylaria sp. CBS 124048]|nr:hypothetical protein GGR50DRAFT_214248 [Xylaria sp. CBS 124048]
MEDSGGLDGDPSSESPHGGKPPAEVINISERGDVILDVTFQNSKDTIRAARKAAQSRYVSPKDPQPKQLPPKAKVRLGFRVNLAVLKRQSRYFEKLLGDARFKEANDITSAFASLSLKGVKPADANVGDLPWIEIHDDDAVTSYAYREMAFADLLRILHGQEAKTAQAQITMSFVTTLAVLADRFDCTATASKYVSMGLKFKWPLTNRTKLSRDDGSNPGGMSRATESVLRQKILVSWLLNQPSKFQAATKEFIMNGSCRWSAFAEDDGDTVNATWWYLQDGLEEELQYRRASILNTLSSVPRHFLSLYTSPRGARQCQLGYDSSVSCDSYQLGEMFKFLTNKGLLFLVDFSPSSLDAVSAADPALLSVDAILTALRQCPAYQIDKNHTNCGLRTRLLPILDFIQALLSANSVPISRAAWKSNRVACAWMPAETKASGGDDDGKPFRFTRSLAGDQRLRFEDALGADKFARDVFTATSWDWTAEERGPDNASTTPRWSWR